MTYDEILEKFRGIVAEEGGLELSRIRPESKFVQDLGMDSLDTVELMMRTEEEFHQEIPDEDAEVLISVEDVCRYIEEKQRKR